jgi:16S rRNA (guanine(1405)-N(7))-methyltransferase
VNGDDPAVASVVHGLRATRKYQSLCADTLNRIAAWSLARHPREKDALKAAKRKLHQVYGAYLRDLDVDQIEQAVDSLSPGADTDTCRAVCRKILATHASSAERLPILDRLYADLFAETGPPGSILDIACGLNPFSLPWMGLAHGTSYQAFDIDGRLMEVADRFLSGAHPGSVATCRDILVDDAPLRADVVLLLKSIPCLEQQQPGAALDILGRIQARSIVISFPNQSLGGADRGMPAHYGALVERLCDETGYASVAITYPTESFYLLRRES